MKSILTLVLAGLSVGFGNFAASIAIGLSGADRSVRLKLAIIFGVFETGMPIVGLVLGRQIADKLGNHSAEFGGGLLILTGLYIIFEAIKKFDEREVKSTEYSGLSKMVLAGLALSVDNLIIGFGLGVHHQPIAESAIIIGVTSVALSLAGLEIGNRVGKKLEEYSELASGAILMCVGLAIALKILG